MQHSLRTADSATLVVSAILLTLTQPVGPIRTWLTRGRYRPSNGWMTVRSLLQLQAPLALAVGQLNFSDCFIAGSGRWLGSHVYMDDGENCLRTIRNDDMNEGDLYAVMSDSWRGQPHWSRRPAECRISTNFGDRLAAVHIREWWCEEEDAGEPFLAVYDDCKGERSNLLGRFDCRSVTPTTVYSSGTCITLYHYRGHTRWRYYFSLEIQAKYEVIAFPAGGIAAIIIASIVVAMVVVKVVCVISGFENRIPSVNVEPEDIKQTLLVDGAAAAGSRRNSREENRQTSVSGRRDSIPRQPDRSTTGTRRTVMLSSLQGHTLLRTTTKPITSSPGTSRDPLRDPGDLDDGSDTYSQVAPPRTTRFTGSRTPRILKL